MVEMVRLFGNISSYILLTAGGRKLNRKEEEAIVTITTMATIGIG